MSYLNTVSAVSDTEAWAGGPYFTMIHYSGGSWQQVALPDCGQDCIIADIDMPSADEGWAVGQCYEALLMHYSEANVARPATGPQPVDSIHNFWS